MPIAGRNPFADWLNSRQQGQLSETRDAIIVGVDPINHQLFCKVQGSTEHIVCRYPENITSAPDYMKVGNTVRVAHKGGSRGKIEVTGHGLTQPSGVGSIPSPYGAYGENHFPDGTVIVSAGAVINGSDVLFIPNSPQLAVMVTTGAIRFGSSVTSIGAIAMSDDTDYQMGMGGGMDNVAAIIDCSSPSPSSMWAGYYRYDFIVAGSDGSINREIGPSFLPSSPAYPTLPDNSVLLGFILFRQGMSQIISTDINAFVSEPILSSMVASVANPQLAWSESGTHIDISINDQYGNPVLRSGPGWPIDVKVYTGNGFIGASSPANQTSVVLYTTANSNGARLYYTRVHSITDKSPLIQFNLETDNVLQSLAQIILLDTSGFPMV